MTLERQIVAPKSNMAYNIEVAISIGRVKVIPRILQLPEDTSVFLFGPRGTGKTTYIRNASWFSSAIYINLLRAEEENRFSRNPDELESITKNNLDKSCIIIDEIQKLPKLLDIVHDLIETTPMRFVLTGSSARKLKHGGANLLAGRAFVYHLAPFTYVEIQEQFQLEDALRWGMLPKIFDFEKTTSKQKYLETYVNTYLKEEVWVEQLVRNLDPFQYFLQVSAQTNGKIINFSNIANDVGVSNTTVKKYYAVLEDTLLGFFLPAFQNSFRKRLSKAPKFYYFDTGVARALQGRLSVPLQNRTHGYGDAFEHFVILQCRELADYYQSEYRFSYLKTKDDAEIDLVVERPGKPTLFIEIKSTDHVTVAQLKTLKSLANDLGDCEAVCFSQDPYIKEVNGIKVYPWQEGIKKYFTQSVK